jgi:hypothetical protein
MQDMRCDDMAEHLPLNRRIIGALRSYVNHLLRAETSEV